jgi:hypothetical protein
MIKMQGKKMTDQNIIGTKQWGETGKKLKLRKEKNIYFPHFSLQISHT